MDHLTFINPSIPNNFAEIKNKLISWVIMFFRFAFSDTDMFRTDGVDELMTPHYRWFDFDLTPDGGLHFSHALHGDNAVA